MRRRCHARCAIPHSRRTAGFTLIELLVVVVIVGVLAAALVISIGNSSGRVLDNTVERFRALLGQACEQAELTGRDIGIVVTSAGYTFQQLDGSEWRALDTRAELRARSWPDGLRVDLSDAGRPVQLAAPEQGTPQLVCFSSGEMTRFAAAFALGSARLRLVGNEDGAFMIERSAATP